MFDVEIPASHTQALTPVEQNTGRESAPIRIYRCRPILFFVAAKKPRPRAIQPTYRLRIRTSRPAARSPSDDGSGVIRMVELPPAMSFSDSVKSISTSLE